MESLDEVIKAYEEAEAFTPVNDFSGEGLLFNLQYSYRLYADRIINDLKVATMAMRRHLQAPT